MVIKKAKEWKIYHNKGSSEVQPPAIWRKHLPGGRGDLAGYENLPRGMIALGTDWYKTLKHVRTVSKISENWMDGHGFTGGHILILMINCFQKAASARYVTSVWIYTVHCMPAKIEMVYSYKAYYAWTFRKTMLSVK